MIKNCTPHPIVINGKTIPPSGMIPRVETREDRCEDIEGFPCVRQSIGTVYGLPDPEAGVWLIVSGMVFQCSDRIDLIAPDTGKTAIRNESGQIIGVTQFIRR